jgi:hypothetical protein
MDALDEIEALVAIGRRAPGSDAERRAARHAEARLTELGRRARIEPVEIWPRWAPAYAFCAAMSVLGGLLAVSLPVAGTALAFAAALLLFVDAGLLVPLVRRPFGRRASQNVVSLDDRGRPGRLVLVAHLDAGRGGLAARLHERRTALFGLRSLFLAQLAVLACCLARVAGVDGVVLSVVQVLPTVVLLVAAALLLDLALSPTRAGENDNASGAALLMRLARLAPPEHFDVCVLFSGAQKAMGAGMRCFVRHHRAELPKDRTVVINLDELGSSAPRFTRREGPLLTRRTHAQLIELCRTIAEDDERGAARPVVHRSASDAYAARLGGLPTITITSGDKRDQAPGTIEGEAIYAAEAFCAELIARIDAQVGPGLAERVSSSG